MIREGKRGQIQGSVVKNNVKRWSVVGLILGIRGRAVLRESAPG